MLTRQCRGWHQVYHTAVNALDLVVKSPFGRHCGGMTQGSRLGPVSFIVLIDDLKAACEVHKFVNDTNLRVATSIP